MDHSRYTPGEWKASEHKNFGGGMTYEIHYSKDGECVCEVIHSKEDAELMAESKNLLQIAEMFYDHLKSTGKTDRIPFIMTSEVLKRLKTR